MAAAVGVVNASRLCLGVCDANSCLCCGLGERVWRVGGRAISAEAEAVLARGIVAQRSGSAFEAMTWYYEAAAYDPSL